MHRSDDGSFDLRRILVVAAFAPELTALRKLLRQHRLQIPTAVVGVGLVAAAHGTAHVLAELKPHHLLLIGTAGVFPEVRDQFALGTLAVPTHLHLGSAGLAKKSEFFPAPMVSAHSLRRPRSTQLGNLPSATVVCPLAISRSASHARQLRSHCGADLENLEAFAVATAAKAAGIPCEAIVGITNEVGPRGHAQWKQYGEGVAHAVGLMAWQRLLEMGTNREPTRRRPSPG